MPCPVAKFLPDDGTRCIVCGHDPGDHEQTFLAPCLIWPCSCESLHMLCGHEEEPVEEARHYAIQSTNNPSDWWSNVHGWTEKPQRDIFTQEERDKLRLPMEGEWVEADPDEAVTPYDDEFPDEHSHEPQPVPGEPFSFGCFAQDDEGRHYWMSHKVTHEGVIIDVYDRYGEEVLASFARTFDELVDFVFANDPAVNEPRLGELWPSITRLPPAQRLTLRIWMDQLAEAQAREGSERIRQLAKDQQEEK